ncbi:MAG: hypothetical protein RL518_2339 [Pseudomonadota bacterium]|jgi:hypothetical protein
MTKFFGLATVVSGSVCILSGCQTTAQHAPPPCPPPAPAFSPPLLQHYSGPQTSSGPALETEPPPLAIPKKVSAPDSKPIDPPKLDRVA